MPAAKLSEDEKKTLDLYIESFRESSSKERKRVVNNAVAALFPKIQGGDRAQKTERQQGMESMKPVRTYLLSSWHTFLRRVYIEGNNQLPSQPRPTGEAESTCFLCSSLEPLPSRRS
jgi:hypothetical protein